MSAPPVVILHGASDDATAPDVRDSFEQVALVDAALRELGHEPRVVAIGTDLAQTASRLRALAPRAVVNLVDDIDGKTSLLPVAALLLDSLAIPYTGAPAAALALTTDKPAAKRVLRAAGLPTPDWVERGDEALPRDGTWLLKPSAEDGSIGIRFDSIVRGSMLSTRFASLEGRWMAERYVEGRELNASVLEEGGRPRVLAVGEITFDGYPPDAPRILDYDSKWTEGAAVYDGSDATFDFAPADAKLVERVGELAARAWDVLGLRGYMRLDVRVDAEGEPWILEANANPCIAPDAGFTAEAERAGLSARDIVERLLAAAEARGG